MPFIEENDLLDLHKDIEKAQIINERLLDQIKFKNKDLKSLKIQRNVLLGISALFVVGLLAFTSFSAGLSTSKSLKNQNTTSITLEPELKYTSLLKIGTWPYKMLKKSPSVN